MQKLKGLSSGPEHLPTFDAVKDESHLRRAQQLI